jgi:hypothetical protein
MSTQINERYYIMGVYAEDIKKVRLSQKQGSLNKQIVQSGFRLSKENMDKMEQLALKLGIVEGHQVSKVVAVMVAVDIMLEELDDVRVGDE